MFTASRRCTCFSLALALSLLCALDGCSISDSVGSISDSSGSIANSSESISDSSKSSSKEDEKAKAQSDTNRYESEIKDYTVTYVRANTSPVDENRFMKGLSEIASDNGIVDWEANPKTYRAIGKGLRKSGIVGSLYFSYKRALASGDESKMADIEEGYSN
jgi:hypothetical protein